jgi:5-methylcytosine-specific restriction protein A
VAAAADVAYRSRPELGEQKLSFTKGCRNEVELLERVTLASAATIRRRIRIGAKLRSDTTLTGGLLPPVFPVVAAHMASGELGVDSADAIMSGLAPARPRVDPSAIHAAETELVAAAIGSSPDSPVPVSADESKVHAFAWRVYLDADGVRPDENVAMLKRGFRFGKEREGLIPVSGMVMPEVAEPVKFFV